MVSETVRQYAENEELVVLIPPEGTRSKVKQWKSGFYHIANNAKVPILLGYVDASKKSRVCRFLYAKRRLRQGHVRNQSVLRQ